MEINTQDSGYSRCSMFHRLRRLPALNGKKSMNQKQYEIIMYYAEKPTKEKIVTEIMWRYGILCIQWKQTHAKNIFSA